MESHSSMKKQSWKSFFLVLSVAAISTALFIFLGTPLLRVLRGVFGSKKYWFSGVFISSLIMLINPGLGFFALFFFSLWINIGVYQELEERGHGNFWTALLSVLIGSFIMILGPMIWVQASGMDLGEVLKTSFEAVAQQLSNGKQLSEIGMNAEAIVGQLPSMLIVLQIASLAFALMLDRKSAAFFGLRLEKVATHIRLLDFRLPDYFIWLAMFSFLLSFIKIEQQMVSIVALNVFNIMMGLYFFQGLAVLEVAFLVFKSGSMFRLLFYLLVVGQLFFLLSLVGVIDYWVDFRQRLRRRRPSGRDQKNGENV